MCASNLERSDPPTLTNKTLPITVMYLIDTYISSPEQSSAGGTEKQLYLLASSLNSKFFRPMVVQLSPNDLALSKPMTREIAQIFHLPTKKFYSPHGVCQFYRLSRLAKKNKVNIIHTFFEKSEVMGWFVGRLAGIPIWVTSRRDLGFKRGKIYERIFRLTAKDCKRCVANCYAVKNWVVQEEGFPSDKVDVIYNGLFFSDDKGNVQENSLRKGLGFGNKTSLVGMIANFNFEIKGHVYFLGAAKKILEKIPEVKFILVGDGPLKPRYEEVARELGIHRNVFFLGNRADVPDIISILNISVLSSTSEGFSNVILESMAAGKPVVATNVGGSKEMIQDGVTGYLVPPSDSQSMAAAIINLLQNPDKAIAMGSAGREVVKDRFTVETMVKKYEELYFSLLKNSS